MLGIVLVVVLTCVLLDTLPRWSHGKEWAMSRAEDRDPLSSSLSFSCSGAGFEIRCCPFEAGVYF